MVGASPDNIGAQRLAEGGVPTSGAGSAKHQQINWNLTSIKKICETGSAHHVCGRMRHLCHSRHASKLAKMAA